MTTKIAVSLPDDLVTLLAEMEADAGPPSAEDRAWARRALGLD